MVELSWKHAHGPRRAVLSATWVRDISRNLTHRALSRRCPAAAACPAVARSSRACIIVYMLYFRIRRRLTSCRLCASHAATKCSPEARGPPLRPHQPCTFAGPNRSPPFLRRSAADSLFCAAPGVFASGCNTGPLSWCGYNAARRALHSWEAAQGLWGRWSQGWNLSAPI